VITNILVKAMTQFPSPQFDLCLHLLPPSIVTISSSQTSQGAEGGDHANSGAAPQPSELAEAVSKLRVLNRQLEGAQYARFWATLDSDDLYADLTTDISGFEEMIRVRITQLVSQAYREVSTSVLEGWLGLNGEAEVAKFVVDNFGFKVAEGGSIQIPKNPDNEAKKAEIREDVNVEMFGRVIKRSWEES
jgi:translation initiation factor 3 subunit K